MLDSWSLHLADAATTFTTITTEVTTLTCSLCFTASPLKKIIITVTAAITVILLLKMDYKLSGSVREASSCSSSPS